MDDPLSLIVWAVFFYSASMMPLGLMLGSACCGCSGDDRVKCFSPTHRCFRALRTYEDGRKTATSQHRDVWLWHDAIEYWGPSDSVSAQVFVSHEEFSFPFSATLSGSLTRQLSYGETASISPSFTASGTPYRIDGNCQQPVYSPSSVSISVSGFSSIEVHGWDYPVSSTATRNVSVNATSKQSGLQPGKRYIDYSKNATLSHTTVGVELIGAGLVANATASELMSAISVSTTNEGEYRYTVSLPQNVFAYSTSGGAIRWKVRVFHGQAAHDDIVTLAVSPTGTPDPEAVVFTLAGVLVAPPPLVNPTRPADYFADGIYHVWSLQSSSPSISIPSVSASQSQLFRVSGVSATWAYSQNPLEWSAPLVGDFSWFGTLTVEEGNYFHAGYLHNSEIQYPCYTRDSSAVVAFMNGESGLVYSTGPDGSGDQIEFRLDADNPLCGLNVTHLPANLLPDTITVSHPDGEPLYSTVCDDCPSSVSMKRTSNEVYFSPAADLQNEMGLYYYYWYYNYGRSYSGSLDGLYWYYYNTNSMTLFAVTTAEVIGHTDAIAYLDGFIAENTKITWRGDYSTETSFQAVCTIGGEEFPEGFDTPLVKHVTSHEATPRTIAVHGHKGIYPSSSYKVEVAVSDVEVVTEWEKTTYYRDFEIVRKWRVNGEWTTTPSDGYNYQDFLEYIQDSYPPQEGVHDLPAKKDKIIDDIKSLSPEVEEVFLNGSGSYAASQESAFVISWPYHKEGEFSAATNRRLKCDGTFYTDPQIGRIPDYSLFENRDPFVDGKGFLFRGFWSETLDGRGAFEYPPQISLADQIPPPPEEIPENSRTYPFYFSLRAGYFTLSPLGHGGLTIPFPDGDVDSFEVAFYRPLSTHVVDDSPEMVEYEIADSFTGAHRVFTSSIAKPGEPFDSYGVYLLKITLSVTVTKGAPPSESCNISVAVGNPDIPVEPISKEDVAFTFNTDCSLPATFRGHIWPHAGVPSNYWYYYYGYYGGTTLTGRTDGHVFHLASNDPYGSSDSSSDIVRTPYQAHPFSPINVGETLYPYPQSTSFRPGTREGSWQGHVYVQGEQHDDLTYSYQFLSQLSVDKCETNKANWRILVNRTVDSYLGSNTNAAVRVAMSRDARFTVIGWYVPDETVRVGYISHKQYGGRLPSWSVPTDAEETFPESGWYNYSRYYQPTGNSGYYPAGMIAASAEATCDSDGRFSVELNESDLDGDISIFVQPVSPKTGRGLIEFVRATPTLEECRDDWTFVTAIYVTKSIAAPTAVVPSTRTYYSSTETLADYAVTGGYVVGRYTAVRLVVEGMVKESSVATRVRLYDALSGRAISQANVGGGDFENGLVTITGGDSYYPGNYYSDGRYVAGAAESALWFSGNSIFPDGQVIQVAAIMEDDLGNESPPVLMSGLIRMDYTSPTLGVVYVNGIEYTSGWLILNDVSKQTPVVISGITEPGCKVKIGNDETVSAGVVTALATTGTGEYSLPTTFYDSPIGTYRSGDLTSTDVAKNSVSRGIGVLNRLPDVQYARISGGFMECRLNYVQKNATVSVVFLRSDGESSPVLTPDATSGTAEATFADSGFSPEFSYSVQVEVTIPNGATVFQEQRDVVQV